MTSEKDLIKLVKSIREPTTLENLMKSSKILHLSPSNKLKAKELLVGLLGAAVRLGFLHENKENYCAASYAHDIMALVGSELQSELDDASSESMEGWGEYLEEES